jgi:receptor protein-tyrosine kinase
MINADIPVAAGSVAHFAGKDNSRFSNRLIGAILIDAGRLSADDAEKILRLQREGDLSFGETAIDLGILTQADVDLGLSRQFDFPYLLKGQSQVSQELIAAYDPFSAQVEALRTLRSQLMLRWFDSAKKHAALAITSPKRNEGRSYLAANLAVLFSQLGARTLLIDADMRNPRQHTLFGLPNRSGLSAILADRTGNDTIIRVPALVDLSVLSAGAVPPNPQELLARPKFQNLLRELAFIYDVILIDTPANDLYADAHSVALRAGAALMVARKDVSHIRAMRRMSESMSQSGIVVVGAVLDEF